MFVDLLALGSLLGQLLGQPFAEASPEEWEMANCSNPFTELTSCGRFSPNGCCAKGCVRNHRGRCVQEQCTDAWTTWMERPVSLSCYFHWFLLIFAAIITVVMVALVVCNISFEVNRCLRQRRSQRFRRFRDLSGASIGSTQC
ncbi:hypothetical protein KR009_009773 [Drosophila setifemur]|nr:hypothetical protein KR009_009773 [Drosophila setifemur]